MQALLGLVGLALIKARYPNQIELRKTLKRVMLSREYGKLNPDQFADAVLKQSKDVFDRLAEM